MEPLEKFQVDPTATTLTKQEFYTLRLGYERAVGGPERSRMRLGHLMTNLEVIADNGFTRDQFNAVCLEKGKNGAITFVDVLQEWFPNMTKEVCVEACAGMGMSGGAMRAGAVRCGMREVCDGGQ